MEELVVKVNNFEGPFDLLLNLIEKKKMMISDINISQLIDEYLEVLKLSERENIEIKSDFIIIASELIEIKTLNLLNLDSDKEKEANLKRRLEEHKLFRELSPKVAKLEKEFNISYSRGAPAEPPGVAPRCTDPFKSFCALDNHPLFAVY